MKKTLATILVGGAMVVGAPIIPNGEMELLYSYQYPADKVFETIEVASGTPATTEEACPIFSDEDANGIISVSKFRASDGDIVCMKIEDKRYSDMGKESGISKNPTKEEMVSVLELLIPPAEAAVAYDTTSTCSADATSCTWSHTMSSGSDGLLTVGFSGFGTGVASSITYGGQALTEAISTTTQGFVSNGHWYKVSPLTGANNVVVTVPVSGLIRVGAISFTGANTVNNCQKTQDEYPAGGSLSLDITSDASSYVVDVATQQLRGGTLTVGAGQTQRWNLTGDRPGAGSTEPGASTVTMSWTISGGDNQNLTACNVTYVTAGYTPLNENIIYGTWDNASIATSP